MADLVIKINGDVKDFQTALEKAQAQTEKLSDALKETAKISGVAFAALTAEVGLSVKAFAGSEAASRKLEQALQNQGIYSKALADSYKEQAEELETLTGVDNDAIVSAQATLQSMIGQDHISKQLTQTILDLAEAKHMDLNAAAELIGKGIEGHITALTREGIAIDSSLDRHGRVARIIEVVSQKWGGYAEAANQGLGSMKGLEAAFDNLQKAIGEKFAPMITNAIKWLTAFMDQAAHNKDLISWTAGLLGAGVAISGVVTLLATLGVALTSAGAIAAAFGTTLTVALGPIGLVSAAIVALGAAIGVYVARTQTAVPSLVDLRAELKKQEEQIAVLEKHYTVGGYDPMVEELKKRKAAAEDLRLQIVKLSAEQKKAETYGPANGGSDEQDKGKKARAAAAEKLADEAEARKMASLRASREEILLESQGGSKDLIDLKKEEVATLSKMEDEKYAGQRKALAEHLEIIRTMESDEFENQAEQRTEFEDSVLASNEDYQAMSEDQKKAFLQKNQQELQAQILTEKTARQKAAKDRATEQIASNNQYLLDQQKFGTAYATINQVMHSAIYQGSKQAFGDLAQLQASTNSTLKGIGKAAAVANIIIKTAESAMNIYAGFSVIPIVGPALGIAGAAAAVAFGAEQVHQVTAAAQGGLITGGIAGVDSVPVLAQRNELISPAQNFEEVIGSVRAKREADAIAEQRGQSGGTSAVVIGFDGPEAERVLTARQVEAQALGLSFRG